MRAGVDPRLPFQTHGRVPGLLRESKHASVPFAQLLLGEAATAVEVTLGESPIDSERTERMGNDVNYRI